MDLTELRRKIDSVSENTSRALVKKRYSSDQYR